MTIAKIHSYVDSKLDKHFKQWELEIFRPIVVPSLCLDHYGTEPSGFLDSSVSVSNYYIINDRLLVYSRWLPTDSIATARDVRYSPIESSLE